VLFGALLWYTSDASGDLRASQGPALPEDIVSVQGLRVHESIAHDVGLLLDAAEADDIDLDGYGYRTNTQQIALRRRHCGSSDYEIYEKPPSECSPPTARPGSSRHQAGLAIDFTYRGRIITSRSSPAFEWLDDNAGRFGLRNLPSEPWHWSVDGR
jgi:LAS superfamily LD-carboxypeptidase LdcB